MKRAALLLLAVLPCACASPGALPSSPLLPESHLAPLVPDALEHAAADVAAAALSGDLPTAHHAAARIGAEDALRPAGPSGLAPAAEELVNAAALPDRRWRDASQKLLERGDLDPAMRARIGRALADDPLVKARARVHDARMASFARAFNAFSEPIGQSILSTALAPYRLGRSLVSYGLDLYYEDPLPLPRRQALAHWKEFLARYPRAPEAAEVSRKVESAEIQWKKTQRRHALRQARAALAADNPREALVLSDRALRYSPENPDAERLRSQAAEQLLVLRANLRRSVAFALPAGHALLPEGTRTLSIRLLLGEQPGPALGDAAPLSHELAFSRAAGLIDAGREVEGWDAMRAVAADDGDRDNMVRHAQAALADPIRNPYDTFVRARARDRRTRAWWLLLGPYSHSSLPTSVDGALQALLNLPLAAQVVLTLPLRVLSLPFEAPPKTAKVTAVEARRYLDREPAGVHAAEVSQWLLDYELARDNYLAALRVAEARDPKADHSALREKAAAQTLRVALKEEREDVRHALLNGVSRRFPGTKASEKAGRALRKEIEQSTPHHIVISRGFLLENPEVAGVHGLDLDPALLDGDASNGELHKDGVALVGGRTLEISYVAASGDQDDPPEKRYVELSEKRLARVVASLEESSFRNALLDKEDPVVPEAQRDEVFERARLGLANDIDERATAQANFTYRGMRERYGVVRRREPILPFDIVVQGSLANLSLGAFPRMRPPKATDNPRLYE